MSTSFFIDALLNNDQSTAVQPPSIDPAYLFQTLLHQFHGPVPMPLMGNEENDLTPVGTTILF
jgi:hypothetical protein